MILKPYSLGLSQLRIGVELKKFSPKYLLLAATISIHLWQASLVRPVADDYTLLRIYSQEGFSEFISHIWNNYGGNVTPAIIRAAFLSISLDGSNWIGFVVYSLSTTILVVGSYHILLAWLTQRKIRHLDLNDVLLCLLASLAFEGLFTPGLSSAYLFGAASGVHLWPICIFILTLKFASKLIHVKSNLGILLVLPFFVILGFVASNSGIVEGISIIVVFFAMFSMCDFRQIVAKSWRRKTICGAITLGLLVGFSTIFVTPGFKIRYTQVGNSDPRFIDSVINFRSSFASFFGEILTHPIWILALIFFISGSKLTYRIDCLRARFLLASCTALFTLLVIGSGLGYAAWHQSSGLILLFAPTLLGAIGLIESKGFKTKFHGFNSSKYMILAVVLLLTSLFVRGVVVQANRSTNWDKNFQRNLCAVQTYAKPSFLGAEIRYWPIWLGIEDVNRWAWMADDYIGWLETLKSKSNCMK
jgi:hypothetical protein